MDNKEKLLNKVTLKILSTISRIPEGFFYEREVARLAGVSMGMTHQTLKLLYKMDVLTKVKKGKINLYKINFHHPLVKRFKIFENILGLSDMVLEMKPFCKRIILFGSRAEGTDNFESDIDLFIISNNKDEVVKIVRNSLPADIININPLIVSFEEYISLRTRNKVLIEEIDKGIVLYGVDKDESGI